MTPRLFLAFLYCVCISIRAQTTAVNASTLTGKFILGYQGWHACAGDHNPLGTYVHWSHSADAPSTGDMVDDIWPDLSEYPPNELFPTKSLVLGNGQPAKVYSAYLPETVNRHFAWMRQYGLDGVMLQRFTKDVFWDNNWMALKNKILFNVKIAAEQNGRVFCIEYDISNDTTNAALSHLQADWSFVTRSGIMRSPRYLRHRGRPLVGIWGLGFNDLPMKNATYTPQQAQAMIDYFHRAGCTVMGGVPYYWRFHRNDASANTNWFAVYRSLDVICPWSVGRYQNDQQIDSFKQSIVTPDLKWCARNHVDYLPVIFPGYSAANLNGTSTPNGIPRRAGQFFWRQAYDDLNAGSKMLFGAMFDEIDEGTAIYKLAPTKATVPQYKNTVSLDVDGTSLPSDWYLRVATEITKATRNSRPPEVLPISPK